LNDFVELLHCWITSNIPQVASVPYRKLPTLENFNTLLE
jgi:hypothetical protein